MLVVLDDHVPMCPAIFTSHIIIIINLQANSIGDIPYPVSYMAVWLANKQTPDLTVSIFGYRPRNAGLLARRLCWLASPGQRLYNKSFAFDEFSSAFVAFQLRRPNTGLQFRGKLQLVVALQLQPKYRRMWSFKFNSKSCVDVAQQKPTHTSK